jgi:hypothetical protein
MVENPKVLKALFEIIKNVKLANECINTKLNIVCRKSENYFFYWLLAANFFSNGLTEELKSKDVVNTLFSSIALQPDKALLILTLISKICDDKQLEEFDDHESISLSYAEFINVFYNNNNSDGMAKINDYNGIRDNDYMGYNIFTALNRFLLNEKIKNALYFKHKIKNGLKTVLIRDTSFARILTLDLFITLSADEKIYEDLAQDLEIQILIGKADKNEILTKHQLQECFKKLKSGENKVDEVKKQNFFSNAKSSTVEQDLKDLITEKFNFFSSFKDEDRQTLVKDQRLYDAFLSLSQITAFQFAKNLDEKVFSSKGLEQIFAKFLAYLNELSMKDGQFDLVEAEINFSFKLNLTFNQKISEMFSIILYCINIIGSRDKVNFFSYHNSNL